MTILSIYTTRLVQINRGFVTDSKCPHYWKKAASIIQITVASASGRHQYLYGELVFPRHSGLDLIILNSCVRLVHLHRTAFHIRSQRKTVILLSSRSVHVLRHRELIDSLSVVMPTVVVYVASLILIYANGRS